jgi:hypothetical protein
VTRGVLLWILKFAAIIEGSGKFWKNKEVPNAYPDNRVDQPAAARTMAPSWSTVVTSPGLMGPVQLTINGMPPMDLKHSTDR